MRQARGTQTAKQEVKEEKHQISSFLKDRMEAWKGRDFFDDTQIAKICV
jgi:hypothetical protein